MGDVNNILKLEYYVPLEVVSMVNARVVENDNAVAIIRIRTENGCKTLASPSHEHTFVDSKVEGSASF